MRTAIYIAAQEWRYWSRTRLVAAVAMLAFLLIIVSSFTTFKQITTEKEARTSLQVAAEQTFRDQPARHPHRMVHYGHYVFRTPTALAPLDPGIDPFTGTVMFLEGHRQNTATFSPSYDGAKAGPFSALTPALTYQLFVPLVLLIIGFSSVTREREASTDRQLITSGVSAPTILMGKMLALISAAGLLLIPIFVGGVWSGADSNITAVFLALYTAYLLAWVMIIIAVSTWSARSSSSLLSLISIWVCLCILAPRLLAGFANAQIPTASQIETDMEVVVALREIGDGHNANDPAFNRLRESLFEKYSVDRVEDLPVNFRGVVAQAAEADLTDILNEYAEKRMANRVKQTAMVSSLQFISPFVALQSASMIAAGTDLRTHHRFLRQAEATRFEFVQGLNKVHAEKMAYADDIRRNSDSEASQRTRMSAENWRVLQDFDFSPFPAENRLSLVIGSLLLLVLWSLLAALVSWFGARRLSEVSNG